MKEISISKAENELAKRVQNLSVEDAVYELAHDLVNREIVDMEREYYIVDEDGLPCMSDSGTSETWYDDVCEDMIWKIYDKINNFLLND